MNRHKLKSSKELYNVTKNYYADGSGTNYNYLFHLLFMYIKKFQNLLGRDNYILNNCKNFYGVVERTDNSSNGGMILFFIKI